ncbi:hypothetical protein A33M_0747 [Rhodovulum sp. PH10]|nr:hypothetical protein A33M_0747 [Rhodovulum sp. PH10]
MDARAGSRGSEVPCGGRCGDRSSGVVTKSGRDAANRSRQEKRTARNQGRNGPRSARAAWNSRLPKGYHKYSRRQTRIHVTAQVLRRPVMPASLREGSASCRRQSLVVSSA